ncbi:MAG TPA: 3-hydroxybutyryl-CoA dehydrogenase, partial [Ardenticatenaceae bacterium]|nr:3-hydroxybutyryl-CoA dehydrogenase [Ardenticatenaceae bacterium]
MEIRKVGVIGSGLMGSGIAETFARHGFDVVVREIDERTLEAGRGRVRASMERGLARGKLTQEAFDSAWANLRFTTDLETMADRDLVVEAIVENPRLKHDLFRDLDRITPGHAILASNTSSLSITEMAAATQRPEQIIGMHFFNPVPVMPIVEIVRGLLTSDATFQTIADLSQGLGKEVVVAQDVPGFIVNLLLIPYLLDAVRALEMGVASKEDIDKAIRLGLNHPMGPFTLLDFVGLDTTLFIADAMHAELKDSRYAAPTLLRRMVTAGLYGRKVGHG